ncbi:ribonuclease domain-containing protein [Rhodococcus sp. NPDC058521]|uniref:ribonuclease domain-containing protein n=1 Tax=Rhodococcus sp. NPDC058521 TaxID=3346536 RepID=UPI0036674795
MLRSLFSTARRRALAVFAALALIIAVALACTPGGSTISSPTGSDGIPARVAATLAEIDAGAWPESANAPGTKGGATFRNNEGHLPEVTSDGTKIRYREWDVNPKQPGRGRDAERIVTGDDRSAWFTVDHYDSFTRIR